MNDDEHWDESEFEDFDDDEEVSEVITCSECGNEVYEDADRCPHCGRYITAEDRTANSLPTWVWATSCVLLILIALYLLQTMAKAFSA